MAKKNPQINGLSDIFDTLIKKSRIEDTKKITEGFEITVRPLTVQETTEARLACDPRIIPEDVSFTVRAVHILARAIVKVNDIEIPDIKEDESVSVSPNEDTKELSPRQVIFNSLMKLPSKVLFEAYSFYEEVVKKQNDLFSSSEKVFDEIKNF